MHPPVLLRTYVRAPMQHCGCGLCMHPPVLLRTYVRTCPQSQHSSAETKNHKAEMVEAFLSIRVKHCQVLLYLIQVEANRTEDLIVHHLAF